MRAYSDELSHGSHPTEGDIIFQNHVACDCDRVRQDTVIANNGVMAQVAIRHQKAIIAQPSESPALNGSKIQGRAFANFISISDDQTSVLAVVLEVLRNRAQNGEWKN